MALLQDRVQETTTTAGTGTVSLGGAVTGYVTFNSVFSNGNIVWYCIDDGLGNWEIGTGTIGTGTLTRSVFQSSNAGALVSFNVGAKRVFCTAPYTYFLPDQTSNSGKVLTTDATTPSWTSSLNGITIGATTAAAGTFTALTVNGNTILGDAAVDTVTLNAQTVTLNNSTTISAAGTKTLTLNGGAGSNGLVINASNAVSTANDMTINSMTVGRGAGNVVTNTAAGAATLSANTTGSLNCGFGYVSLAANTTGASNVACGRGSLQANTTGNNNIAVGRNTLQSNLTGNNNSAFGDLALNLTTGSTNTAIGYGSGSAITTGNNNVILGSYTGSGAPISGTGSGYVILSDSLGAVRGVFDASGNFGIGASPSNAAAKLEVLGTYTTCRSTGTTSSASVWACANDFWTTPSYRGVGIQQSDSAATGTTLGVANANLGSLIFQNTSNALIYTNGGSPLIFGTAGVERARIDTSGNLCVGTTSASSRLTIVAAGQNVLDAASVVTALPAAIGAGQTVVFGLATPLTGSTFSATDPRYLTFGIDPVSGSYIRCHALNTYASTSTTIFSTTYTAFVNGGTERARIDASGNLLVTGVGGLGYGTGSGGAVTQITSRTTGVTLNKTNGAITLVSAAGLATYQTFTVTNSTVAATDVIHVCQKSGTDKYIILVTAVAAGSFAITYATTGGTTTEQPVFNFAIIKAVTA